MDTLPPTKWNNEFAKLLKPVIAKDDGFFFNYGLALQPTPPSKARLTDEQKRFLSSTVMSSGRDASGAGSIRVLFHQPLSCSYGR
jgi:hypothetical protein